MISKLSAFIERYLQPAGSDSANLSHEQKQLATAALLIEVAMADQILDVRELALLKIHLQQKFFISDSHIDELVALAKSETEAATSLHQFTHLINQYCTAQEKFALIVSMWELAYADEELDKYEEYVIRKVADLIYISHSEFIRAKTIARSGLN